MLKPNRMSAPKKQHYVPQLYLREFLDPNTPPGYEPYVWIFAEDGKTKNRRAPKNVLWEMDLYTLEKDGTKQYELEELLSKLEGDYAKLVRGKVKARLPLSDTEHITLCAFVAAMLQRTVRKRDNLESSLDELISKVERLEEHHGAAPSTSSKLKADKKDAHRVGSAAVLSDITELLHQMSLAFFCTDGTNSRFITSDDPVAVFNPDLQWQRFYGPGIGQKNVQITMPISPDITVCLTWSNLKGYIQLPRARIEDLNRMTRGHCYRYFIADSRKTKFIWFSRYPLHDPLSTVKIMFNRVKFGIGRLAVKYRYGSFRKR